MVKEFTNQELKIIINNLYVENNFSINDDIKKLINKSSRVHYDTLYKHYTDIKNSIVDKLIISENSSTNDNKETKEINEIQIQTKEIETQTEIQITEKSNIINPIKNNNDLLIEIFKLNQELNDYKFRYNNIKKEFKQFRKLKENNINKNYSSSDEEIYINKEHRKIPYSQLPEMSSVNIINELSKLSRHNLKQLYNKYFSNKLNRKLE